MARLAGKTILVTGGGSGIGLASARALLAEGAKVAIAGRDEAKLKKAADSLHGGERVLARTADVADAEQVKTLVDHVRDRFGPVDILVNNAGLNIKERGIRELTPELWQRILRTNLDGAFYRMHAPSCRTCCGALCRPHYQYLLYCRKAGLAPRRCSLCRFEIWDGAALGLCVAAEEKDSGVRVSTIYPGEVNTPILEKSAHVPLSEEHLRGILQPRGCRPLAVVFVVMLPPHVSVPELVMKPTGQVYI